MPPGETVGYHVQMTRNVAGNQGDVFVIRPFKEEYDLVMQVGMRTFCQLADVCFFFFIQGLFLRS